MADAIAQIRDLDCECRAKWAQWLKEGAEERIQLLQQTNECLQEFIHARYAKVVDNLKRDIRIFTATTVLMFLLLLAMATLLCSYFYVFEQNCLLTTVYNDYLGFTYLVYLGVVFGLLCDIALNRARVCTEIINPR